MSRFLSQQPYKGTRDFYPDEMRRRAHVWASLRNLLESFGFEEYDGPMLEPLELYAAKTGEEIVRTQLYHFLDRGDRAMAIRPEMTPTLARMVSGKFHELPKPVRWYSIPNLWRYERPQKGRLREHWQWNVDILGGEPQFADLEILRLSQAFIETLVGPKTSLDGKVEFRLNHRNLMNHLFFEVLKISETQAQALSKKIDAKDKLSESEFNQGLIEIGLNEGAIKNLQRFFSSSLVQVCEWMPCLGSQELQKLFTRFNESGAKAWLKFDPSIMRGMDYYTGMVFEVFDLHPEHRRAMFGGGRYDNLLGLFQKENLSGVGFGMGDVTLQNFLEVHQKWNTPGTNADVCIGLPDEKWIGQQTRAASIFRKMGLRVETSLDAQSFGNSLKMANRKAIPFCVLFGEKEWESGQIILKDLTAQKQLVLPIEWLERHLNAEALLEHLQDRSIEAKRVVGLKLLASIISEDRDTAYARVLQSL